LINYSSKVTENRRPQYNPPDKFAKDSRLTQSAHDLAGNNRNGEYLTKLQEKEYQLMVVHDG
jgi:hypothetical protein